MDETTSAEQLQDILTLHQPQLVVSNLKNIIKLKETKKDACIQNYICILEPGEILPLNEDPSLSKLVTWNQFWTSLSTPSSEQPLDLKHYEIESTVTNQVNPLSASVATLVFTSGSTGKMKAVGYTQNQIIAACDAMIHHEGGFGTNYKFLAWLPMAPLFQRVVNLCGLMMDSQIYLFSPPQNVFWALKTVRPSFFIGVPRFFEKFQKELQHKVRHLHWLPLFLQKNFLKMILLLIWPRRTVLLSGSAPLRKETHEFFENLGYPIFEAYGLTECLLVMAINTPHSRRIGSVGRPLKQNQIKFDENQQILVKSPFLAPNYILEEEDTHKQSRWDSQQFFHTGDIGSIDSDGFLFLTGRMSFFLKLSNGRKVFRTHLENDFSFADCVDHFLVFGNQRPFLLGFISCSQIPSQPELWVQSLKNSLIEFNRKRPNYEQIKKCLILNRPLSIQQKELTGNLKVRYEWIETEFKEQIDAIYSEGKQESITYHFQWIESQTESLRSKHG